MKCDIGYYTVDDQQFASKYDAVLYAQATGKEVNWYFFDDVFEKVDWSVEPELTLNELYRIRAQQIRDKYDYIIVFCSGGADSTNVIKTFLDNNIHVDEVIGIAPISGLNNWKYDEKNFTEDNTISEVKFAMFPLFDEIASRNPNIKITINDYFEDILKQKDEQWTFDSCGNIVTVLTSHFTDVAKFNHIDKLIQQGKKVGLIYGTDKPIIRISETGNLYFVFADAGINYLNLPNSRNYPNVDRVLFYWTPDLPELLVKQAHIVAKAISLPENSYICDSLKPKSKKEAMMSFQDANKIAELNNQKQITKNDILNSLLPNSNMSDRLLRFSNKSIYQRLIVPFIYPTTWSKNLFQCQKVDADAGFFTKDQAWVHILHKDTKVSGMVISGVKSMYNSINPKYLNSTGTGFINNVKIFKFGNLDNFKNKYIINR